MTPNVRLQFRKLANVLAAEAAVAGGTGHSATSGRLRELIVQRFLRPHLPGTIEVRSGVILDSRGNQSRQQDIILVDARHPTVSVGSDNEALIIAESVLATIEVKTFLSVAELASTLESISVTKNLHRSGQLRYQKRGVEITTNAQPILTYVFAFDGANLNGLLNHIGAYCIEKSDGGLAPEAICLLTKGTILRASTMPIVKAAENGKETNATLPSLTGVECTATPLTKDALYSFYGRLYDDVVPLQLIHYDLDPYFNVGELQ